VILPFSRWSGRESTRGRSRRRRGHRVDPETVGVMALEPEERAVEQGVRDLVASAVEDQRAPVGMVALPRVGVLVERGAVEVGELGRAIPRTHGQRRPPRSKPRSKAHVRAVTSRRAFLKTTAATVATITADYFIRFPPGQT
jgi:hypothetical protein